MPIRQNAMRRLAASSVAPRMRAVTTPTRACTVARWQYGISTDIASGSLGLRTTANAACSHKPLLG